MYRQATTRPADVYDHVPMGSFLWFGILLALLTLCVILTATIRGQDVTVNDCFLLDIVVGNTDVIVVVHDATRF